MTRDTRVVLLIGVICTIGLGGLALAVFAPEWRSGAAREIGSALVSGAVIGAALLAYEQHAEAIRQEEADHREQLHVAAADELDQVSTLLQYHLTFSRTAASAIRSARTLGEFARRDHSYSPVGGWVSAGEDLDAALIDVRLHYLQAEVLSSGMDEATEICHNALEDQLRISYEVGWARQGDRDEENDVAACADIRGLTRDDARMAACFTSPDFAGPVTRIETAERRLIALLARRRVELRQR